MNPLEIIVFTPMPESWGLCTTCEAFMARASIDRSSDTSFDAFPQEWLEELKMTSALIYDIAEQFGSKVIIRIFDPRTLPGIFKAIRYRAFKHPTYVIGGKEKVVGNQREKIWQVISDKTSGMTP